MSPVTQVISRKAPCFGSFIARLGAKEGIFLRPDPADDADERVTITFLLAPKQTQMELSRNERWGFDPPCRRP